MTRLVVRRAEYDGAIRLAVANGMKLPAAIAAADYLYVVDRRHGERRQA